jgi:hypothetical protein
MRRSLKFVTIHVIFSYLLIAQVAKAETKPELRHVNGFQGIGLSAGTSLEAPCLSLDYTYHLARAWQLKFGLAYSTGQKAAIAMDQLGLQALLAYTCWSHQSNYYTNLLAGCNLAYRWQENMRKRQQQTYLQLDFLVGCGLETYLTNHLVLTLLLAPQIHSLNTDVLGLFQLLGMLGLQYAYYS